MTDVISAPSPVTTETVPNASPAAEVKPQSAEQTVSPQAETPAGQEQQAPVEKRAEAPPQPTEAELRRKERNQRRWQEMKNAEREAVRLRAELDRYKPRDVDYSQITDPDELLAEKTAAKVVEQQRQLHQGQVEEAQKRQLETLRSAYDDIVAEGRERIPDFDQVVNERTPLHERAVPYVLESENAAELLYWLGRPENAQAARALYDQFRTAPQRALVELGRIEARLSAPPSVKTATQAPKPAPVLTGGVNPMAFDPKTAGVGDMQAQLRKAGIIR